ncbi:MAG TPA: TRAP transporter small permease [Casimicrobiaceae bacterium]|nr:TRAP transporter small permease [Casimicrobiaceae bacterium]
MLSRSTRRRLGTQLQRRAENVLAALLGVMFFAFIVQIVFRYFFNFPTGWTTELTVVTWLWMVLWGAAFVVKESEEIRIDLVTSMVGRRGRIVMGIVVSVAIVILYAVSLPASYSYVTFMKVEKSSYLKIPMNWLFSIYLFFVVAVIGRYLWLLADLLRGRAPDEGDPTRTASAL